MSTTTESSRTEHLTPDPNRPIMWADTSELEQEVDSLRRCNWITEDLIAFSQKHWRCSREDAISRLVAGNKATV